MLWYQGGSLSLLRGSLSDWGEGVKHEFIG